MRLSRMNRPTSYSSTTPTPPWICSARRQTRTAPSVPYHFTSGVSSRRSRAACSSRPNSTRSWSTAAVYASARAPVTVVSMSSSISATMGCSRIGFPIWMRCAAYSEAFSNAAVATPRPWIPPRRRGRRKTADVRPGLRFGHRDRAHHLALRERRQIARLLLVGAEAIDERRRRVPPDAVLHLRREIGAGEHLADHHRD